MKRTTISTLVPILAIILFLGGRYFYFKPRLIQGEKAPAFTAVLAGGEPFSLDQLKGKYVLLDFWGSWCPPCRAQNPRWVDLYRRYDTSGLVIVSIGVEKNRQAWENAIAKDGLFWNYHIFDQAGSLRFFDSPIAELYGVKQLPTTFLLNPEGVIIAYDPRPSDVARTLDRALNGN